MADEAGLSLATDALVTFEVNVSVALREALREATEEQCDGQALNEALSLALSFAASDGDVSREECQAILHTFLGRHDALESGNVREAIRTVLDEAGDFDTWKFSPSASLRLLAAVDASRGTNHVSFYRASAVLAAKTICALDGLDRVEFSDLNRFA